MRSYVSAINELWAHQTSRGLHAAPRPQGVALAALKQSLIRGQHARSRAELVDRGKGTIKDGYTAAQIPDLTHAAWAIRQSKSVESSLRTWLDFLLGNRLPLELPDLFALPLPTEGQRTEDERTIR